MRLSVLTVSLLTMMSTPAMAQDSYTPPPMFGAPPAAPATQQPAAPSVQYDGTSISPRPIARPRYSPMTKSEEPSAAAAKPEEKYTGANNPLLPPVITKGDPALKKPQKPSAPKKVSQTKPPVPTAKPAIKAPAITPPAPAKVDAPTIPAINPPAAPTVAKTPSKAMPASRVTSDGVVTGPKTMPSVPTTDVASESTFEAPPEAQTMMERHQNQQKPKQAPAAPPPVAAEQIAPATAPTSSAAQMPHEISIPFEKGVTETDNPPVEGIVQALNEAPSSRLMIQAYASPTDDGENSDRRTSLARALSVRKVLRAQGVPSHRMDIRSLGQKTDKAPVDRVDLTVYNGQKPAN